jgi:hypothetical protein
MPAGHMSVTRLFIQNEGVINFREASRACTSARLTGKDQIRFGRRCNDGLKPAEQAS